MKDYLNEILVRTNEAHPNAFDTKGIYERFQKLDENKKEYFNKLIKEKLFGDVFWRNCFSDDVYKIIYTIFDEIEK